MSACYDLVVIGSGPAGYVAAIHAAQNGLKTAIIEKNATLGGTCLNVGCIPTKALLFSASLFDKTRKFASYGIRFSGSGEGNVELDFAQVNRRKDEIVKTITGGVAFLMKKNKIEVIRGVGKLFDANTVTVVSPDGLETNYSAKNILLATGSKVKSLPHIEIDGKDILSSDHILFLEKVPASLAVLGGGVVGCEFASCYGRFGSQVTIFEMMDQLIPTEDRDCAVELARALRKQNCEVLTGVKVTAVKSLGGSVAVQVEGEAEPRIFEKVLVSVGRSPCTADIGLEKVGIALDKRGFIEVSTADYRTTIPNIFAVGDIIPTAQLAHLASAEALYAVDVILGKSRKPIDYQANPGCIYTYPEVASVGLTEAQAKAKFGDIQVGKFAFLGVGKARIDDTTEGFVKIVAEAGSGKVVGVHITNAKATELISGMCLGINLGMTIEDLAHTIHPHPTISEGIMEAAHAALGHAIHA